MVSYFAYGSNMSQKDLDIWCSNKGHPKINIIRPKIAKLKGYKIDFNYYSQTRQGGAANLMESPEDIVWGLLINLDEEDYKKISKKEGAPDYYYEINIIVNVGKKEVPAKSFKVVKNKEKDFQIPTEKYLNLIIDSAVKYKFPEEYIRSIIEKVKLEKDFRLSLSKRKDVEEE